MAGVSPEYKTMIACTGKLVSNIEANSPAVIAHKLQAEWLLARDVYKKLDLPIKDDADRARDIVRNVTDKVYANHKVQFPKFVAVLRNCEGLGDLLQTIEKIFGKFSIILAVYNINKLRKKPSNVIFVIGPW